MVKTRLDVLLVEKGLAESRAKAQALVMARQVRVDGQVEERSAKVIPAEAVITVEEGRRFVSRGGDKLEAALQAFEVKVNGRVCADVGASTGGFSDCLLQHGAARVYAIDVGKGLLHWKLRTDRRVVVMEGQNARHLSILPESVQVVTIDASFISLKILLPVVKRWFQAIGSAIAGEDSSEEAEAEKELIVLIKPQFEAGRKESARHKGVIRDPAVHETVLRAILGDAQRAGFAINGLIRSPVLGPKGNVEFLAWLRIQNEVGMDPEWLIRKVRKDNP